MPSCGPDGETRRRRTRSIGFVSTRVFRVRVSRQFGALSESTRSFLVRSIADHSPSSAAFGQGPNLTYTPALDSFSLRIEVRLDDEPELGGDLSAAAASVAIEEAELFLNVLSVPHRRLRVSTTELTSVEY